MSKLSSWDRHEVKHMIKAMERRADEARHIHRYTKDDPFGEEQGA